VLQCYAPTEDNDLETKESFFSQLDNILSGIPEQDLIVLMGDFNAKVGNDNTNVENVMVAHMV
jgi:endonuclease/exonuclease/phosphatase family metal-dependent hydrolase